MDKRLERYFEYVKMYPFLFTNPYEKNSITIILDFEEINRMQNEFFERATSQNLPKSFYELGVVCEDEWYVGLRDLVEFPNGLKAPYVRFINKKGRLQNAANCVIMPFDQKMVLFQREFRHDLREERWLTPRGFGEIGLTPEENAKKELVEETGYDAQQLIQISQDFELDTVLYLAKVDSSIHPQCNDGQEVISQYKWLDLDQFTEWINKGLICDEYSLRFYVYLLSKGFPD